MPVHHCQGNNETHVCGCITCRCNICGVSHATYKCPGHQPGYPHSSQSESYYGPESDGIRDGIPQNHIAIREWQDAFQADLGTPLERQRYTLDIGAGICRHAPLLMRHGASITAIEPDPWAARFLRQAYQIETHECSLEHFDAPRQYEIVIAAHALEHFPNAPAALAKMATLLAPGGRLFLIVPDDRDLTNPDHFWHFTRRGLEKWCFDLGLTDIRSTQKSLVEKEDFIYLTALKGT